MATEHTESRPLAAADDRELRRQADELLAWGGQHRVLLRPLYEDEQGVFPEVAESAEGYEVVDASGRRFIDWTCAWGPVLLGYRHPAVEAAIKEQLEAGPLLPLMHRVELEVAAMLVNMIPCAEMVAFGKNGSDVTTAAIRLARASTGRELVLQWGFHGFHDWYTCQYRTKYAKGIPTVLRAFIHSFEYNDLESLEWLFQRYPDEVAAVIMEPVNDVLPEPGYLESVRDLTHRNGALLIFDEVVTGFRMANGGAQEHFGVVPDLACFGKAVANGMPLAAIVGRRQYMKHLPDVAWGMTYRGETLSLAAARAVLQTLEQEPVIEHLAATGSRVRDGFQRACEERGIRAELAGPPARMGFVFHPNGGIAPEEQHTYFLRQCASNGVLTNGMILPSYAHDAEAIERTLEAFSRSLDSLSEVVEGSRIAVDEAVRAGFADAKPVAGSMPSGSFDSIRVTDAIVAVEGWILGEHGALDSVELVGPTGEKYGVERRDRPDLAQAFPDIPQAAAGGYQANLPASAFASNGGHEFTVVAKQGECLVFQCRVVRAAGSSFASLPALRWIEGALRL